MLLNPLLTRFAPTPSGYLHLGNVFNFMLTWVIAKQRGAKILLRIDDADAARTRDEYVEDIFNVIEWLKLDYDVGPTSLTDFKQNYSQHLRKEIYDKYIQHLHESQLLFACTCSRQTLLNNNKHVACLSRTNVTSITDASWRLNDNKLKTFVTIKDTIQNSKTVDYRLTTPFPVVRKKDGFAAYNITSLADDLHFGVNIIVRGIDLIEQTAIQQVLAQQTEANAFKHTQFFHHNLLRNAEGQKLSKSAGVMKQSLIQTYKSPETVYEAFAKWMGIPETPRNTTEMLFMLKNQPYVFHEPKR